MSIVSDLIIAGLTAYIAFTNTLALEISSWFETEEIEVEEQSEESEGILASLPSRFTSIPDVLKNSLEYQRAALVTAPGIDTPTTNDPIDALVNIFCTFRTEEYIKTTTGTGFFVDADGVILTNAHVAQFLLLAEADENGDANCTVRSGDPASAKYMAALLYIPPAWIQANAAVLNDVAPMGTGERDYALLYVTDTVDEAPLPATFPALPFSSELLSTGARNASVVAAGYPAGNLATEGSRIELTPLAAETSISELYTFGSNRADVFAIRGSVVGAEGASGGPVLDDNGDVIGMITTRGDDAVDGPGSLRAITLSHVHRTMLEETGFGLADSLGGNLPLRAEVFKETVTPFLLTMLQAAE